MDDLEMDDLYGVGPIETDIPIPTNKNRPLSDAQKRVLELQVGESFVLKELTRGWVRDGQHFFTSEAARLPTWARSRGLRLSLRKVGPSAHRIWRVA